MRPLSRIGLGLLALVSIAALWLGGTLAAAHRQIRSVDPAFPSDSELRAAVDVSHDLTALETTSIDRWQEEPGA